jgi:hypothetical protein
VPPFFSNKPSVTALVIATIIIAATIAAVYMAEAGMCPL